VLFRSGNGNGGQIGNNMTRSQLNEKFPVPAWVYPIGPDESHLIPQNISTFTGDQGELAKVVAGPDHTAALFGSGILLMWGRNNYGQCGQGHVNTIMLPRQVLGVFTDVTIGYDFTVAIDDTGAVYSWGDNIRGQLGVDVPTDSFATLPIRVPFFDGLGVTHVACGSYHCIAIGARGKVFAWGDNNRGQLGLGHRDEVTAPVLVPFFARSNTTLTDFCGGRAHSIGITRRGDVYAWGSNDNGQLGLGPGDFCILEPRLVPELSAKNFTHVTCGYDNSFAW